MTDKLPLGAEVEVREMRGREEELLSNPQKMAAGTAIDEVLANVTVKLGEETKVTPAHVKALLGPDRLALLMLARRATYGDLVDVDLECAACRAKFSVEVNLAELPVKPVPEGGPPFTVTLSNGQVVVVGYLNGHQELALARVKHDVATANLLYRITDIAGVEPNDRKRWLLDLPMRLRNELRNKMFDLEAGIDTEVTADCIACGVENKFAVNLQPGFFSPKT